MAKNINDLNDQGFDLDYKEEHNKVPLEEIKTNGKISYGVLLNEYTPEELPTVSVVTITYKREYIFDIAIRNWEKFVYPEDKIEWIILDDSPKPLVHTLLKNKLGKQLKENKVKYIHLPEKLSNVSIKRNAACEYASNDIICFMDDDDYYYPDSIMNRVKVLLDFKKQVVGSTQINCVNLIDHTSYVCGGGIRKYNSGDKTLVCAEATLGFYKSFWEKQKFSEEQRNEEILGFLMNRTDDFIDLLGSFIIIALSHGGNMSSRAILSTINAYNFIDTLDVSTVKFLEKIQKNIFFTFDENKKAVEFQQKYGNIGSYNIVKRINKLPENIQMTPLILDLRRKNPTVKSSDIINIVYISGLYIKNLNPFGESVCYDEHEEQMIKIAEFYKNSGNKVKLYFNCGTSGQITTENKTVLEYDPWWKYVPKNHSRLTIVYREYEFLPEINTNKLVFLTCDSVSAYPEKIFDKCDLILVDHAAKKFSINEKTGFPIDKIKIFPFFRFDKPENKQNLNYDEILCKNPITWERLKELKKNYTKIHLLKNISSHMHFKFDYVNFVNNTLNESRVNDSIGCIFIEELNSPIINYVLTKCPDRKIVTFTMNEITELLKNQIQKDNKRVEEMLHDLVKFL